MGSTFEGGTIRDPRPPNTLPLGAFGEGFDRYYADITAAMAKTHEARRREALCAELREPEDRGFIRNLIDRVCHGETGAPTSSNEEA